MNSRSLRGHWVSKPAQGSQRLKPLHGTEMVGFEPTCAVTLLSSNQAPSSARAHLRECMAAVLRTAADFPDGKSFLHECMRKESNLHCPKATGLQPACETTRISCR